MPGQFHAEAAHINALLAQFGDFFQRGDGIMGVDGVADLEQVSPIRDACHAAHKGFVNFVVDTGTGVQDGECVTHRAVSQAANQLRSVLVEVDFLFPGDIQQTLCDIICRDAGEIVPLAAT